MPIKGIKSFDELPVNAKHYLKRLEELLETRIDIISTGPERENTIIINKCFNDKIVFK